MCHIMPGPRGLQVSSVLGILAPADNDELQGGSLLGRVKFYDTARGFGFVCTRDGHEVFVGAKTLRKLGLLPLREDQAVRVTVSRGARGLIAETLTFVG